MAFSSCQELIIEKKSLYSVDVQDMAFYGCENMQDENGLVIVNGIVYGYFGNHKKVIIPYGVTKISGDAFSNCKTVEDINIPDTVEEIGSGAFGGCTNLKTINIPMNVGNIGEIETFDFCDNLTILTPAGSYAE